MARLADIRDCVDNYTETLLQLYEKTDPGLGFESELGKLERAQHAIEVFWYLHGKLLMWAQAHLTGYAILSDDPGLVSYLEEKLGEEINEDSHILEQIGLQFSFNPPDDDDPDYNKVSEWLLEYEEQKDGHDCGQDEEGVSISVTAMRTLIVDLLMSRSADNSYWRFDLQHSLRTLNEGEVDELVAPKPGKRHGLPYTLARWKLEALRQVRFRVGQGMKKYRALEDVAEGIGQSAETLRDWEKEAEQDPDRFNDLYCCELAGSFREKLKNEHFTKVPQFEEFGFHRGTNNLMRAQHLLRTIEMRTFDEIRDKIREYRQKKSGG